jgi:hypothetical protein
MIAEPWRTTLSEVYEEGLDELETAIRACPDNLWGASVWEVRPSDRHVWPIVRGLGAELPDDERLQLYSAFWRVVYHALFWLDHYLAGGVGDPAPPPPFRSDEERNHTLPHRVYSREELLDLLAHCRRKASAVLDGLTDEDVNRPARIGRPFADLLVRNLVQLYDHAAQLNLFLNNRAGFSDPRYTPADRWYRRCPDCPPDATADD